MEKVDTYAQIIWNYMLMHQEIKLADAIFALGSNDTRTAERAAELYNSHYAPYVICSGGFGKTTHLLKSETQTFADILMQKGVPKDKIIIEDKATNTGENILFTKKLLEERGLNFKSFILVQKPYMERRTFATFSKQWPGVEFSVTSPQIPYEDYWKTKPPEFKNKFIDVMVGDLERIKKYPELGFQIPQEIPGEVWNAYLELVKLGFVKYKL
ncbi:MAG: YdcF family protein [bacterium]